MEESQMHKIAVYVVSAAALFMASSALASTTGTTPAQQACLDVFMKNLAETYQPAPRLREARFEDDLGPAASENRGESWNLTATDPHNNRIVARATCLFDGSNAEVAELRISAR
jgi:hypothetical protein